jgi:hypothetical protein
MVTEIRQALDSYSREQLADMLTWVFKDYVVDGAAPIAGVSAIPDLRTELEGLSFAELVTWLQLHCDAPELALFEVQGTRVSVRAGGRALPLEASAPAPAGVAAAPAAAPPVPASPSAAVAAAPSAAVAAAPSAAAPARPATPAVPAPAAAPDKPAEKKEEQPPVDSRFSLLEVD